MIALFWSNHGANQEFPGNRVRYAISTHSNIVSPASDVFIKICDRCARDFEAKWLLRVTWEDVQPVALMGNFTDCAKDHVAEFEECVDQAGCDVDFEFCKTCSSERELERECRDLTNDDCWMVYFGDFYRCIVRCMEEENDECYDTCGPDWGNYQ